MIKVGTTFSGIGAPEQALKNLNIPHIVKWACDIDKHAKKTYLANHTCERFYDDITTIDINTLEYVDLYVFGFPCQSISNQGKRDLSDGRSMLVTYSLDIIDKILPKYLLFENVAALLQKNFKEFATYIFDRLSKNYNIQYKLLDSKHFGVPQNRNRVYCIGIRKDINQSFIFPDRNKDIPKLRDFLDKDIDNKYYINKKQQAAFLKSTREFDSDRIFLGGLKYGSLREDRPFGACTYYGQLKQVFSIDGVAATLCTWKDVGKYMMDDGRIRILTPNERRRIQGFPEDFKFMVSENELCKQFGNTITVNVLEAVFTNLLLNKS